MSIHPTAKAHSTAIVEDGAILGKDVRVWHFCHVRKEAKLEEGVSLGRDVYVDQGVILGKGTRVQNGVSIYVGVKVEDWCFIGPHAIFTNDPRPRAGKPGWVPKPTILRHGMSIGAGSIIRCGVEIGAFAMVGAGSLVTKDVPPFTLVLGLPAEQNSKICACGETLLPMGCKGEELIQACCKPALLPEVFEIAKAEALKTAEAKT